MFSERDLAAMPAAERAGHCCESSDKRIKTQEQNMEELVADTAEITDLEQQLDALDRHGYLLVRGALNLEMVEAWRECLTRKYKHEEWDISNEVGNVAFDHLLEQEPDLARPLVGHASVATYLRPCWAGNASCAAFGRISTPLPLSLIHI